MYKKDLLFQILVMKNLWERSTYQVDLSIVSLHLQLHYRYIDALSGVMSGTALFVR